MDAESVDSNPRWQWGSCNPIIHLICNENFHCDSTIVSSSSCTRTTRHDTVAGQTEASTLAERTEVSTLVDNKTEASSFANKTEISSVSVISVVSSFSAGTAGTGSLDSCSVDSIGRMLIRLEDNDPTLTGLIIDCKELDIEAASEISVYLPKNRYLRKLRLKNVRRSLQREVLCKVLSGLRRNSSVEFIGIEDSIINPEVASWLIPIFAHRLGLKSISMTGCKGFGLEGLFVAMQQNKSIRNLRFRSCYWEDHHADIVALSLTTMELHSLSLVDINIAADGWPYLFRNIEYCRELASLDLSRNELDASLIYLLTKSMALQKHISKLSLSLCDLDDLAMMELASGLRHHPSITNLDISQNIYITDEGVKYILDLLKNNNAITELNVHDCSFRLQSLRKIQSGLRYNNSYMKNIIGYGIYGAFDSIFDPDPPKGKKNHDTAMGNGETVTEERDAGETTAYTSSGGNKCQMLEDRNPPDDDLSIMTEVNVA